MSQSNHSLPFRERSQQLDLLLRDFGKAYVQFTTRMASIAETLEEGKKRAEEQKTKAFQEAEQKYGGDDGCIYKFLFLLTAIITAVAGIGIGITTYIGRDSAILEVFRELLVAIVVIGSISISPPLINKFIRRRMRNAKERAAEQVYYNTVDSAEEQAKQESTKEIQCWRSVLAVFQENTTQLLNAAKPASLAWTHKAWRTWELTKYPNGLVCFGTLYPDEEESNSVPALLPFPGDQGVLCLTNSDNRAQAQQLLSSLLLRLLATVPAGKLRFTFFDPVGLGQNTAAFMRLGDYLPDLITSRTWTEARHLDQRLSELTEHMETVIQKYLRTEFNTIDDYNVHAGEVAEPYRLLVIYDFPVNFTEESARRLLSIIQNGPRCGVYTLMTLDGPRLGEWWQRYGQNFNLEELVRQCAVISLTSNPWFSYKTLHDCPLELDPLPPADLVDRIINTVGAAAAENSTVQVPFNRIAVMQHWQASGKDELAVPIGPSGARRVQSLTFGVGTAQHALVAGRTGAGKSTLLHVLITNLALKYSPDEVQLYLIDFKKGVEFKVYATHSLPHARVIAIDSEREFGLSVLQGLDAELNWRGERFRAADVDNLAGYRERTGEKLPRLLLLVDEFQEFFTEDDAVAQNASRILDRLVRQGRAFGVHVLLGSQSLAGAYALARSTVDQMAIRIALQCSEADSRLILAEDNAAARLLNRPGEAIYNDTNGLIEGNQPFQVAYLQDEERNARLAEVQQLLTTSPAIGPLPEPIIFEGNAPAFVEKNHHLRHLLTAPPPSLVGRSMPIWLGDPIAIADPTSAAFRRQSGANLLLVGQNSEAAASMLAMALVALAAQHPAGQAHFYLLDYGTVDAPEADLLEQVAQMIAGVHPIFYGRRKPEKFIDAVAAHLQDREQLEESQLIKQPTVYLLVYGLHRARDLRLEDGYGIASFGYHANGDDAPPNPAQQFQTILSSGAELGIHTLAWCDTVANLNRIIERRVQREFEMRVAFQMSAEDSANLLDTPAASRLGPFRALYVNHEEGVQQKFRPYGLPDGHWLNWLQTQLQKRAEKQLSV